MGIINNLKVIFNVEGRLSIFEMFWLIKQAKQCKGNILEIGSFKGLSTILMSNNLDTKYYLTSVDPYVLCEKTDFWNNVMKYSKRLIISHKIKSDEYFKYKNNKFSFIFIDGDHSYGQVKKDYENSLKLLKPGGIISLHDSHPKLAKGRGPDILAKELIDKREYKEYGFCRSITWFKI